MFSWLKDHARTGHPTPYFLMQEPELFGQMLSFLPQHSKAYRNERSRKGGRSQNNALNYLVQRAAHFFYEETGRKPSSTQGGDFRTFIGHIYNYVFDKEDIDLEHYVKKYVIDFNKHISKKELTSAKLAK